MDLVFCHMYWMEVAKVMAFVPLLFLLLQMDHIFLVHLHSRWMVQMILTCLALAPMFSVWTWVVVLLCMNLVTRIVVDSSQQLVLYQDLALGLVVVRRFFVGVPEC